MANKKTIKKLLIANRGEIACRIMQACRSLGIKTVAVYSDADANARHVRMSDESVRLGPGPAAESYLKVDAIIEAALSLKADAIHPGYGFLSERSTFARAVQKAGLIWVGPNPDVIDLMGNKVAAKLEAEKAKVPTLPWAMLAAASADSVDEKELVKAAKKVGYPLLLKASAGGGGRGMRLVHEVATLVESAVAAMREAQASFGSSEIFMEAYRESARHVEVQIIGDSHGNVYSLGERDCSAQRRHQKVIEEAPAPKLDSKTRQALWKAAVSLGKGVGYSNAGTCEFLVDADGHFHFLEMNTRLQVEHPVTELVWGVDLVALQLSVAAGHALPEDLAHLVPRGHAIEARVYAENPAKNFMPSPGKIKELYFPHASRVRVDTGYEAGDEVPIFYDAMVSKVIVWGADRDQARRGLIEALQGTKSSGVIFNTSFLADILLHQDFADFSIDTKWIERAFKDWKPPTMQQATSSQVAVPEPTAKVSPWFYYGTAGGTLIAANNAADTGTQSSYETSAQLGISGPLTAEHPGKVLSVKVKAGSKVKEGATLIVCESMKMEFSYTAPCDAVVKAVAVTEGQIVAAGTMLVEWEAP